MLKQLSTKERDQVIQNFAKLTPAEIERFITSGDTGIGNLYAAIFDGLRVYQDGEWYLKLDSGFWELDETGRVSLDVGEVIPELLSKAHGVRKSDIDDVGKYLQRVPGQNKALDYSGKKLPYIGEWDDLESDALIACENGIITKSGKLRDPKPTEYARRKAPVIWEGIDTPAPLWEKTTSEIFGDDPEIIAFVQSFFGYVASGKADQKKFPVFYGAAGDNGKSKLLSTFEKVLGRDYSASTEAAGIMENKHLKDGQSDKPNQFVYELQNKRLLLAHESRDGQRLDSNLIKMMTGGDTISVRKQHGRKIVHFEPTHTTILVTNNLPKIDAGENAMWNRVLPVNFTMKFVDNPDPAKPNERKIDRERFDKILSTEKAGVMAWIVRGWLDYRANGLQVPAQVAKWRDDYRQGEKDQFDLWIETLDTSDPNVKTAFDVLYTAFDLFLPLGSGNFAQKEGYLSQIAFGKRLIKSGFAKTQVNRKVHYIGLKL